MRKLFETKNPRPWTHVAAQHRTADLLRRQQLARLQEARWPERAIAAGRQARLERHYPPPSHG